MGRLLLLNRVDNKKKNLENVSNAVAYIWVLCNIKTKCLQQITGGVERLFSSYKTLSKYSKLKKNSTFQAKLRDFKLSLPQLFDIKCSEGEGTLSETMYRHWGVRVEPEDLQFYENQKRTPPLGTCPHSVDRHSAAKSRRSGKRDSGLGRSADDEEDEHLYVAEEFIQFVNAEFSATRTEVSTTLSSGLNGSGFQPSCYCGEFESSSTATEALIPATADELAPTSTEAVVMPEKYRHVRHDTWSVRPEIYSAAHTLSSTYHLSGDQIEGAFIVVGGIFGRRWKPFHPDGALDKDTLPDMSNLERRRNLQGAMAVNKIVSF